MFVDTLLNSQRCSVRPNAHRAALISVYERLRLTVNAIDPRETTWMPPIREGRYQSDGCRAQRPGSPDQQRLTFPQGPHQKEHTNKEWRTRGREAFACATPCTPKILIAHNNSSASRSPRTIPGRFCNACRSTRYTVKSSARALKDLRETCITQASFRSSVFANWRTHGPTLRGGEGRWG